MKHIKALLGALLFQSLLCLTADAAAQASITVGGRLSGTPISEDLFGVFFEDLNYAADGGLYAELIQNRSFEYSATEQSSWGPFAFWDLVKQGTGQGELGLGNARPVHKNNPHYLLLTVTEAGAGVGIANRGFDQIKVEKGQAYEASFWAYQTYMGKKWGGEEQDQKAGMPVCIRLENKQGKTLAEAQIEVKGRAWRKYTVMLQPGETESHACFMVLAQKQGGLALDMVSLFPQKTFKGRKNGLRQDLAQSIADLKPRFMRFPGGCLVHGPGIHQYYDWKKSIGPVEQRSAQRNSWGYHQTLGLGYFEYFQYCEDIGAKPLPVVSAGVCCQHAGDSPGRGQEALPLEEMPAYIQDLLDLIEWANGGAETKWGALRAAAGHTAPFGLKYLGVGNEDAISPEFQERFKLIHEVLRQKHPEIVVIGTAGPFHSGDDFDKGWAFARANQVALVDEHYYVPPEWFWDNLDRYDSYDRKGPHVYVGEYAAHDKGRRNTLSSAIAEAAYLTSLERNGDVVSLSSYAPLLARRGHTQWTPDMIYFTGTGILPTLNHAVQRLFGNNAGARYLSTKVCPAPASRRLAASTVLSREGRTMILKIVNGEESAQPVSIQLEERLGVKQQATCLVFGGAAGIVTAEEGMEHLLNPVSTPLVVAQTFHYNAPANSVSIIKIPIQ